MAVPVIESSITAAESGGNNFVSFTYPSGIVSGDLLLNCCVSGATSARDFHGKTGWTQLFDSNGNTAGKNGSLQAFWKVADGTESGSSTWSLQDAYTDACMVMVRISGAEDPATTPIVWTTSTNGSSDSATAPSIVTTDNDSLIVRMTANFRGWNDAAALLHSGYTRVGKADHGNYEVAVEYEGQATAGSTGTESLLDTPPSWWGDPELFHGVMAIAPSAGSPASSNFCPNTILI